MADGIDASIPLGIKVPDTDISKPMNALANLQLASAHAGYYNMQNQLAAMRINALGKVGDAMRGGDPDAVNEALQGLSAAGDPEGAKTIQGTFQTGRQIHAQNQYAAGQGDALNAFPEVKKQVADTMSTLDATQRANVNAKFDVAGRAAQAYLATLSKDPITQMQAWNAGLRMMEASGRWTPSETKDLYGKPNPQLAKQLIAEALETPKYLEHTGETARNQPRDVAPTTSVVTPSQLPGAPPSAVGPQSGSAMPNGEQPMVPPKTPKVAPGGATFQPAGAGGKTQPVATTNPHMDEVPEVPLNMAPNTGQPGVLRAGTDPAMQGLREASFKQFTDEVTPKAEGAQRQLAELGAIRSSVESDRLKTGRFGELRATLAGFIYEVQGHNQQALNIAKNLTGTDPSVAEVANKSSTRLGFDMARTQGAREAVQVITMALGANPNIMNTKEGALKLLSLLENTSQWDIDRRDYMGAYIAKNNHGVNFDQWFNRAHPLESYTSKAIPYQIPRNASGQVDVSGMKHGVTYEYKQPQTGKHLSGVFDATSGQFNDEQELK